MVNDNRYEIKPLQGIILKIIRKDKWVSYVLMENQLVSILYLDENTGKADVYKGRIIRITTSNVRTFDNQYKDKGHNTLLNQYKDKGHKTLLLDISIPHMSKMKELYLENILDVHEIDWEYPDISKAVIDGPFVDWESSVHDAEAPTHSYEITLVNNYEITIVNN